MPKIYCEHTVLRCPQDDLCIAPALVTVEGTKITAVKRIKDKSSVPKDARLLKDKLLSPAFVDSHTHLAMSFFRGLNASDFSSGNMVEDFYYRVEGQLTAADVRAFTRMGIFEALSCGTGFVWDHYFFGEAIADAFSDLGFSGVIAPTLQDLSGPGKESWQEQWEATRQIAAAKYGDQAIFAAWGPHASDSVSPKLWGQIHEAASSSGLPVHAHLAQSREEYERAILCCGQSPVAYLHSLGVIGSSYHKHFAHSIYLEQEDFALLRADRRLTLTSCPSAALIFDFPADPLQWELNEIAWAIGTDCVGANDSHNLQKELRLISGMPMQRLGYSSAYANTDTPALAAIRSKLRSYSEQFRCPAKLLERVWTQGSCHPGIKVGRIEEEALANLVVWDLKHPSFWPAKDLRALAFCDTTTAIDNVMVSGQWMASFGNFQASLSSSPAYQQSRQEAEQRLAELRKRLSP